MTIRQLLTLCMPFAVIFCVGNAQSADEKLVLPKNMTPKEKSDLSSLRKTVDASKKALDKKTSGLVSYFTGEYPDTAERLEKAGIPGSSAGVPGGTRFQPGIGGSREMQELQRAAAKQKATHAEVHKALEPKWKAVKEDVAKRIKEASSSSKSPLTADEKKKIEDEALEKYKQDVLPICEKSADDDYRKEKKTLEAKIVAAEKELRAKKASIIKAHEPPEKSRAKAASR